MFERIVNTSFIYFLKNVSFKNVMYKTRRRDFFSIKLKTNCCFWMTFDWLILNTVLLFRFLFHKALRAQFSKISPWCTAWKFICTYLPLDLLTVMTFWLLFDLRYEIYHIKQISLTKLEKLFLEKLFLQHFWKFLVLVIVF